MNFSKLFHSAPFLCVCVIGFITQSSYLTKDYLEYKTMPKISIKFPQSVIPPYVSFCPRASEVVSQELRNHGRTLSEDMMDNLTMQQIMQMSPKVEDVLSKCQFRLPRSVHLVWLQNNSMCNQMFALSRFFTFDSICYRIGLKSNEQYNFELVSNANEARGVVYALYFNRTLLGRSKHVTIIFGSDKYPYVSRFYSYTLRFNMDGDYIAHNHILYSFGEIVSYLLPHPYVTNCGVNNGLTESICKKKCLMKNVFEKLNLVAVNWIVNENDEHLDRMVLTAKLLRNESIANEFVAITQRCAKLCHKPVCTRRIFDADYLDSSRYDQDYVRLRVLLPQYPTITTRHEASFVLNDYIMLLMACLGTWLGVSMADLNPAKWQRQRNDSQKAMIRMLRNRLRAVEHQLRCREPTSRH